MSRRSDVAQEDTEQEDEFGLNTVMLFGSLSSDAVLRELPSGEKIVNLEVTTSTLDGRISVPVTSKATLLEDLCVGDEVFVTGVVKRRFFRAGPALQSRTEVHASKVISGKKKAQIRKLVGAATDELVDFAQF
ncbi:MAG: hypothetical protein JHD14_09450 [Ilumatobacteraceae bacterium]|nr:hypothetical protein [Ilumatobacteraceae bacterium]